MMTGRLAKRVLAQRPGRKDLGVMSSAQPFESNV